MTYSLSNLARACRPYALNQAVSDEDFLNALIRPYVVAARVRGRGDAEEYHLDKSRTSRVLAGKADVPTALRKMIAQYGLEGRVARECGLLFEETLDIGLFEGLKADILGLLDDVDPRQEAIKLRLLDKGDPCCFVAAALMGAVGVGNLRNDEGLLWKSASGSLRWCIGDLLDLGFRNRKRRKNLIVIPVDCGFETHVTRGYEGIVVKKVSEASIHGQWLTRMSQVGVSEAKLRERIGYELEDSGYDAAPCSCPIGTIAAIERGNAAYLLLAISEFDEKGNAHSTVENLERALRSLLEYYDQRGQGADLYLPLLGTGLSRVEAGCDGGAFSLGDSFDMIRRAVTEEAPFVPGKITIVLKPEAAGELGLTK